MDKLIKANAKLFLICVALQLVCASPIEAQSKDSLNLGSEDHVVYIDFAKLPTKTRFENADILSLYDAKRSAESFYHKWGWGLDNCPAGSLREGVVAYCLPCVGLGRHRSDPHHQQPDRFVGIGPVGIVVLYEPDTDRFYLWNSHWNFSNVLGPFDGNPKLVLNQAIKPRKQERHFPGANLSVVSQRWLYPDERLARVPPGSVSSDCSMDGPCVRDVEQQNLNTFITRFRLVNNTGINIYYLGELNSGDPVGYTLPYFVRRTDCNREVERQSHITQFPRNKWKPLQPGASVEFEVQERGWQTKKQFFGVLINTEPTYWDEVEVLVEYTSMFRTLKTQPGIVVFPQ
jgi:hypothetical protein